MTQHGPGYSTGAGGRKVEPKSKAVNPAAVSGIGIQEIRTKPVSMHVGRGFEAPAPVSTMRHKGGTQGKY